MRNPGIFTPRIRTKRATMGRTRASHAECRFGNKRGAVLVFDDIFKLSEKMVRTAPMSYVHYQTHV